MADIHFIRLLSTYLLFPAFITITYIHPWVTLGCMEEKKISGSTMNQLRCKRWLYVTSTRKVGCYFTSLEAGYTDGYQS